MVSRKKCILDNHLCNTLCALHVGLLLIKLRPPFFIVHYRNVTYATISSHYCSLFLCKFTMLSPVFFFTQSK